MNSSIIEKLTSLINQKHVSPDKLFSLYLKRGRAFRFKGELDKSIQDYTFIIEKNTSYLEAYYERGFSKYLLGQLKDSLDDLQTVISNDHSHSKAYFTKSIIMTKLDKPMEAIDGFSMVIELNHEDSEAYYNRGLVYSKLEKYRDAINDFNHAIKIKDDYFEAYDSRGYSQFKLKKYKQASIDFKKSIEIDKAYFEARVNYARCLEVTGDREGAIEQFKEAQKLDEVRFDGDWIKEATDEVDVMGNFQNLFLELEKEFKESENKWLLSSIFTAIVTLLIFICMLLHSDQSKSMYFIHVFLSIITATVVRQYTNTKKLRIEAVNRVAMAKLFQEIQGGQIEHSEKFIDPIIRSLVYSMRTNTNKEVVNTYSKLQDLVSK